MLYRLRVSLPDRPGSLARVTQLLGGAGADVMQMTVLEQLGGRAVDEFTVSWAGERDIAALVTGLERSTGVRVEGCWAAGEVPGAAPELDVLGQVARDPGRAVATLIDAAPTLFHADWAVATRGGRGRQLVHQSWRAPEVPTLPALTPMRPLAFAYEGEALGHGAAAPIGASWLTLYVVRHEGPAFHRSELERLGRIVDVALGVLGDRGAAKATRAET
ncbi:ACT domain-containing protein [Embleya sp. NBC_00896]|uniref:ACT domain-containing protein n=1 Tax=Embleya sp. NBC_00896 TaxID=2975961 RepID=UPI00386E6B05|nr:ACT domain-containing protein [Embleya sp. NBC_00896]